MAKVDMKGFRKSTAEKKSDDSVVTAERREEEKTTASPMLKTPGSKGSFVGSLQAERKTMILPISKTQVTLKCVMVDPRECVIHPNNRRNQALLRIENPRVAKLRDAIQGEGQRDPVLARLIGEGSDQRIEIIDGSRRRFVVEDLQQTQPDVKLKVWLAQSIGDVDADYLTRAENENRDDISAWETAQYIKRRSMENPSWSHEVIGAQEGMSRQSVANYLQLGDLPLSLVALMDSPNAMNVKSGIALSKACKGLTDADYKKRVDQLQEEAPFASFNALLKAFKSQEAPLKKAGVPSANRKIEITDNGKVRARIGKNRSTAGRYKIDVFNVSDDELQKLEEALRSALVT